MAHARGAYACRDALVAALAAATARGCRRSRAQAPARGQNVVPVYEGFWRNADGTFDLLFGYYNRNWEEEIDVPVGPGNTLEPGGPDQGQPTHFFPRRNQFVFKVRVPANFGNKEVVWTLTSNGETEKAYATLQAGVRGRRNRDDGQLRRRRPDRLRARHDGQQAAGAEARGREEAHREGRRAAHAERRRDRRRQAQDAADAGVARRPEPLRAELRDRPAAVVVHLPGRRTRSSSIRRRRRCGRTTATAATLRGRPAGARRRSPPGNTWTVRATFSEPGTYVLRALATTAG